MKNFVGLIEREESFYLVLYHHMPVKLEKSSTKHNFETRLDKFCIGEPI